MLSVKVKFLSVSVLVVSGMAHLGCASDLGPQANDGSSGGTSSAGGSSAVGGSSATGGGTAAPTFAEIASDIQTNCGNNATCHGAGTKNPPVLINDASLYATLSSLTVDECGGSALVVPNNAAGSSIIKLMKYECGDLVMPDGCTPQLCDTGLKPLIEKWSAWIAAGAAQ